MKQRIYADNAATTKLDSTAFDEMRPYLLENYGNPSQPYGFAKEPQKALKTARERIARCINADPDEIFFTSCGTESDNWVIKGVAFYLGKGHTTITSEFEHHAVLNSAAAIERLGYPVAYLRPDHSGVIKPTELDRIIAVSYTHLDVYKRQHKYIRAFQRNGINVQHRSERIRRNIEGGARHER